MTQTLVITPLNTCSAEAFIALSQDMERADGCTLSVPSFADCKHWDALSKDNTHVLLEIDGCIFDAYTRGTPGYAQNTLSVNVYIPDLEGATTLSVDEIAY